MSFENESYINKYIPELENRLKSKQDLEQKIDELRIFKKEKYNPIIEKILHKSYDLLHVTKDITLIADAILISAAQFAKSEVQKTMGVPRYIDKDANYIPAELAIIGMGKLGAQELHFSSDLDIIFVYNRNSEAGTGRTNQEIFSKIAQRLISYLNLYTRYGYAYKVDTELRPSGNAGALVTAFDPWTQHYQKQAALWEKQALLKSRVVYAGGSFASDFEGLFTRLIFLEPFPKDMGDQIHHLRQRIETELAKETQRKWHFKKGKGALIDIEFAVQFLQLKLGKIFPNIVTQNTLEALERLKKRELLSKESIDILQSAYKFYRHLEFFLELKANLHEGYIDIENEYMEELANFCGFNNKKDFLEKFQDFRLQVRDEYLKILKIKNN